MKIGFILGGLFCAAAMSAAVVEVKLTYPQLPLKNGQVYRDVAITSFNPAMGTALLVVDKKLTTVPIAVLPDDVAAKLKELTPAQTAEEQAAEKKEAAEERKRSLDNAERRQRQAEEEVKAARDANRTSNMKEAERVQAKIDQMPDQVAKLAEERARSYFKYQDDPWAGMGYVSNPDIVMDDPEPVPGWTGRYRVCGSVHRQYVTNTGGGLNRNNKEFEILIDTAVKGKPKVVDITVK